MKLSRNGVVERLTLGTDPAIYECCGLFDLCTDTDLMSLSFEGQNPFLDWLTWRLTLDCIIHKEFIHWVRPEQSRGVCTEGYLSDPCEDPNGVESGTCGFELRDFARLRRQGPVRDVTMNAVKFCEQQPRYRLDGSEITDQREYDMRLITEVILQDLKRMIISGNKATAGQFDGLGQLVKTNYIDPAGKSCTTMDSIVVDWNGNTLAGGAGITWNGVAQPATANLVDFLRAILRNIKQKISWAPAMAGSALRVGDIVLVMPAFMTSCLLDMFACWSMCVNSAYINQEATNFRNQLNGGMFGAGRIYLDGFEIPLAAYDWDLITGPTTADIYMLTGSVGPLRVLEGQVLDLRPVPRDFSSGQYAYTDGGRLLTWTEHDHTCYKQIAEMRPRLLSWAPWAQARIENVVCNPIGPVLGPDPCDSSYFPETSFSVSPCK